MTYPRLGGRSHTSLSIEGIERAVELTRWAIIGQDGGQDFASTLPDRVSFLEGESYQSTAPGSLWRYTRDHSGREVAFVLRPHGNETPTTVRPHYSGRLIVGPKPDLGGSAGVRWFPFAFTWRILGEPAEVTS